MYFEGRGANGRKAVRHHQHGRRTDRFQSGRRRRSEPWVRQFRRSPGPIKFTDTNPLLQSAVSVTGARKRPCTSTAPVPLGAGAVLRPAPFTARMGR